MPSQGEDRSSELVHPEGQVNAHGDRGFNAALYTVGWICALSTEFVAAKEFLDEEHKISDFAVDRNDNNDYAFGRVGKHNIVLAVMPIGEYGTGNAAIVARDMIRSFKNLRIALMVGIGGGAPLVKLKQDGTVGRMKRDIRLGDIVVSSPGNGQGGVFQYDYGKVIQGQPFRHTGHQNSPPKSILGAIAGLRADIESQGHTIDADVGAVIARNQRLRKKYSRPKPASDRLYRSSHVHPAGSDEACIEVCGDDESTLVSRLEREELDDDPAIHYGLVASGNSLMKDALLRDTLAEQNGVLCFEMEAANLMSQFPTLVIRGICDYSDSHKNDQWHGYAAMTAAAYAKMLLLRLKPDRVEEEKTIVDALGSGWSLTSTTLEHRVLNRSS